MPVLRTIPSTRVINGTTVQTSECAIVSEYEYLTYGESTIVVKGVSSCKLRLNSSNTDHVVIKALTKVLILPDRGSIDEEYDEIELNKGACVEFRYIGGCWYILSSDGLKFS
jgi:hypothetical protein